MSNSTTKLWLSYQELIAAKMSIAEAIYYQSEEDLRDMRDYYEVSRLADGVMKLIQLSLAANADAAAARGLHSFPTDMPKGAY